MSAWPTGPAAGAKNPSRGRVAVLQDGGQGALPVMAGRLFRLLQCFMQLCQLEVGFAHHAGVARIRQGLLLEALTLGSLCLLQ